MEQTKKVKRWKIALIVFVTVAMAGLIAIWILNGYNNEYRLSHGYGQTNVSPNQPLAKHGAVVVSSGDTSVRVDVMESNGIVESSGGFLKIFGPATLQFTFAASGVDCVMGYGNDNAGGGYDMPLSDTFETTVDAAANTGGIYYAVCKNPDGSWGEYANVNVSVYDPKAYPAPSGTVTKFLALPNSGIKNPQ